MAVCLGGCATSNLSDNPVNNAAGALASGLRGLNRAVESGLDAVDRGAMNVQSREVRAGQFIVTATLGTRRDTGLGPNPDTTYRPALDQRSRSVCAGPYRILQEENPQVDAAIRRRDIERRPVRNLEPGDRAAMSEYPEAGLVWLIRCGDGPGWSAPSRASLLKADGLSASDRQGLQPIIQAMERAVANVPSLDKPLLPTATLVVPSDSLGKDIATREKMPNSARSAFLVQASADALARAIERRSIFASLDIVISDSPGMKKESPATVYLEGSTMRFVMPGAQLKSIRLDTPTYRARVGPIDARAIRLEEGITLALTVLEAEAIAALPR